MRRCLVGGGAVSAVGVGTAVYARYVEPFWPKIERIPMPLPGMNPRLEGFKLVQLSDLHLMDEVSRDYLTKQLEVCARLKPDLLVITGDFVTRGEPEWIRGVESLLWNVTAPYGVYATLGNHDYAVFRSEGGISPVRRERAQALVAGLSACGIQVLRNQMHRITIGEAVLQIVGLDDLWSGAFDAPAAFAGVDPDHPCIALSHNPDTIESLANMPCHWILCGHTHGGQVRLPFFGAPRLPIELRQYDAGLFDVGGKKLYVNRGLGYLRPIRLNCRPEITEFILTASSGIDSG